MFIEHYFSQDIDGPYEKVDYCLNKYDDTTQSKYPVLFSAYKELVYEKITNSKMTKKNLMGMVNTCMKLFHYLIESMDALTPKYEIEGFDVISLTEMDIRKIITGKNILITYVQYFGYYLTYLQENKQIDVDITIKVKQGIKRLSNYSSKKISIQGLSL